MTGQKTGSTSSFFPDDRDQASGLVIPDPCHLASVLRRPGGYGEVIDTRSHPELGRENPQRQWYCVLRRGRVGRRQVFPEQNQHNRPQKRIPVPLPDHRHNAGWSSPIRDSGDKQNQPGLRAKQDPDQTK